MVPPVNGIDSENAANRTSFSNVNFPYVTSNPPNSSGPVSASMAKIPVVDAVMVSDPEPSVIAYVPPEPPWIELVPVPVKEIAPPPEPPTIVLSPLPLKC